MHQGLKFNMVIYIFLVSSQLDTHFFKKCNNDYRERVMEQKLLHTKLLHGIRPLK